MEVCLLQTNPDGKRDNIAVLKNCLAQRPANLYVLPELFTTGFGYSLENWPAGAEEVPGGLTCRQIRGLVKKTRPQATVVFGIVEKSGSDFYNDAVAVGNAEAKYRQRNPALRRTGNAPVSPCLPILPGDEFQCVPIAPDHMVGLMVCNDHWTAEDFFVEYKRRGAKSVVWIAESAKDTVWFKRLCGEYHLNAVLCNAAGNGQGKSCVIDVGGAVILGPFPESAAMVDTVALP